MDIASLSIGMSQGSAMQQVGVSVMKIAMDDGKQNAEQMTKMMENTNVGQNFDARG
jgi:hypothetical protein